MNTINPLPSPPSISTVTNLFRRLAQNSLFRRPPLLFSLAMNAGTVNTADTSGTSSVLMKTPYACHDFEVVWSNYINNGGEGINSSTFDMRASLEAPDGTIYPLTFGGNVQVRVSPYAIVKSDPVGISLPAGAVFYVRTYHASVSGVPPAGPAAQSMVDPATGQSIGSNTCNYKVTGAPILSAATNASPIVCTIYGGSNFVNGDTVTISGATGNTAANGTWTISGVSGSSFTLNSSTGNGSYNAFSARASNADTVHGTGSDQTQTNGHTWQGYETGYVFGPICVLASPDAGQIGPVVAVIGDSIAAGQNSNFSEGYIVEALLLANVPYHYLPKAAEQFQSIAGAAGRNRWAQVDGCTDAICEYGVNNIFGGQSLLSVQAAASTTWAEAAKRGCRVWQTTLTPETSSTDGFTTAGNQTAKSGNAVRVSFNDWLRDGAPVTSASNLTAVVVGAVGALRAGSTGHPLSGYFEAADKVEVNATNQFTRNGGLWYCGPSNNASYSEGTHPNTLATALLRTAIDTSRFTV